MCTITPVYNIYLTYLQEQYIKNKENEIKMNVTYSIYYFIKSYKKCKEIFWAQACQQLSIVFSKCCCACVLTSCLNQVVLIWVLLLHLGGEGVTWDGLTSHPEGEAIVLFVSYDGNWDKLLFHRWLGTWADFLLGICCGAKRSSKILGEFL